MREGLEYRAGVELRAVSGRKLAGYASVFDTVAQIGRFREVVRRGAFTTTLADRHDVVGLVDHDASRLLARTASGTLRLAEDNRGLAFELDLPDTTLGRDMHAMAERRDLAGMSIGFVAQAEAWPSEDMRELRAVKLVEISIAQAWPAYPDTSVALRSRQANSHELVSAVVRRRLIDML